MSTANRDNEPVRVDRQVVQSMIDAPGGGGGASVANIRQSAKISNGGGGPGGATFPAPPLASSLFVCLAAANGNGLSSLTQTNVTWTLRRHDNVAAVGALDIWTGVATGTPGSTVTGAGMSGAASFRVYEVAGATFSAFGQSVFAGVGAKGSTLTLHGCVPGSLLAMVVNTLSAAPGGPCILSGGPYESETDNAAVHQYALGVLLGTFGQGWYAGGGSMNYSLVELLA